MNVLFTFDREDYDPEWPIIYRRAVRGIIEADGKLALVCSEKYGDIKFPGGGMEAGEEPLDTLTREVKEETGMTVIPGSTEKIGKTIEIRKAQEDGKIIHQTSYYYRCRVAEEIGERNLDDYEEEYGYTLVFLSAQEAHQLNSQLPLNEKIPWLVRETAVLGMLSSSNPK